MFTEEIKKSRFITLLQHTDGVDEAKQFIQSVKDEYPDARHHCWAFVAGRPDDSQQLGFSDDGEPTGTAGKPMIAPLLGSGIRNYGGGCPLFRRNKIRHRRAGPCIRQRGSAGTETAGNEN